VSKGEGTPTEQRGCCRAESSNVTSLLFETARELSSKQLLSATMIASGAAKLTTRRLISLHGEEAPKFLQGIITNNVKPNARTEFYAAFLTAPGKVLHDVFIYPTLGTQWHKDVNKDEQHGYLVEVDAEHANNLLKHIKKHKLRSKFKLRLLDDGELDVWSVWREDDRWTAHTQGSSEDGTIGLTDCRAPGMGQRLLLRPPSGGSAPAGLEVDEAPLSAYIIRRYLRGVPEGQKEIPHDEALPMNYNIDIMGGIDFKKGCYVGQELTIRTHHTGVVRRRVLPVMLYPHDSQPPEKLQYDPTLDLGKVPSHEDIRRDDKRKRSTGKLITSIGSIGLGMCRLEQMTDLVISGEGSSFSPDDRFLVQGVDGKELGVKAFVPDWMRGRIREPKIQRRIE
jgi:transferase CAF17, mitochondrial